MHRETSCQGVDVGTQSLTLVGAARAVKKHHISRPHAASVRSDVTATRQFVPPSPRTVLKVLTKPRLVDLSRELGVPLKVNASKDEQLGAFARHRAVQLPSIVRALGRDELKRACREHGLDSTGRSRTELAQRILDAGQAANDSRPPSSAPRFRLMPVAGDIVVVRQRQYLVSEVVPPATPGSMTLVRLVCLDDDAQGRPLEVLWELELGARVLQHNALELDSVTRLDEPREFAAYFHALKWNRVTAADGRLFQAPFRAGIALKSYQLTPLHKALELPRANLFIADDVGLGKTVEAGLVVQELLLRQRIDWVLIVCPASVTLQWKGEMERRFGLSFEVYNRDFVMRRRQERGFSVNAWTTHNRFIVSYQTFRRPEYRDALLHALEQRGRSKSLLVLDEAHTAAPATASKYAVDSLTTKAIRELCAGFENRLFLSATPHNGHSNSFSALLEMLDPQRFLRGTAVSGPEQLRPIMVRRLKADLTALGTDGFPERRLVQVDLTHEGGAWLARYVDESQRVAKEAALGPARAVELELGELLAKYTALVRPAKGKAKLVFINLQKRLLSSVEAFARTLQKHAASVGVATTSDVDPEWESIDGEEAGLPSEAEDAREEHAVITASEGLGRASSDATKLLQQMLSLSNQHRSQPDAKARALVAWIREHLCPAAAIGGAKRGASTEWTERRVIVFTEYGHTKAYLRKLLDAALAGTDRADERISVFDGGMGEEQRALLQEEFNGDPKQYPVRILIATDAAREGVNLQGHCSDLFHYDIPWNPGRLEQRNGRIDRTLQREREVRCHYFYYPQRREDNVLRALVPKLGRIQRELGSVGAVLFDDIAESLEKNGLEESLLTQVDTGEGRLKATSVAPRELEQARSVELEKEINQAARLLKQSRNVLELAPELLRDAIDVGLAWANAGPLEPVPPPKDEPSLSAYRLPALDESWAATLDSARPARRRNESLWEWRRRGTLPVVFDAPTQLSTPVVQLHLKHPIVQRILARFLAQGYSAHDLSRVTVLSNPNDDIPRVIALGRLSLFGHAATRLHDGILAVASALPERGEKLTPFGEEEDRAAIEQLEALFAGAPRLAAVPAKAREQLRARAPQHFAELWPHLEQEAKALAHDLVQRLRQRGQAEAEVLTKIIRDQMRLAERTLHEQLAFDFSEAEREQREQLQRDRKHITNRRAALERELATEPQAIRQSYEVLRRRVEPVGLVYLWPKTR